MKKSIVVLLVFLLLFSGIAYATPTDVKGTAYETAVDRLISLGLLTGYPDGSFKPDATITRAEFAAVIVRALGETAGVQQGSTTRYIDVPSTHWAAGLINRASSLGIIKGYSDGKFGPSDAVTYEQAVTMMVRALGYEPAALAKGGYPSGHLSVAFDSGLLEGVSGKVSQPAHRGLVGLLVDNALEVPMMIQVAFGDTTKYLVSGLEGTKEQTLLTQKLGLKSAEKRIATLDTTKREVGFDGDNLIYTAAAGVPLDWNLVGLNVTVLYKDQMVYALTVDSTIIYGSIDGTKHSATEVTLVGTTKAYKVASSAQSTLNDAIVDVPAFTGIGYDNAYGMFILNQDNEITLGRVLSGFDKKGILTEVTDTQFVYINIESPVSATVTRSNMNNASFGFVEIDGKRATFSGLKKGMFIEFFTDYDGRYYISANTGKVTGTLDSINIDLTKVDISGLTYPLNSKLRYSKDNLESTGAVTAAEDLDVLTQFTVTAYKNSKGELIFISGLVANAKQSFYGILKEVDTFQERIKVERPVDGIIKNINYSFDLAIDDANIAGGRYVVAYDGMLDPNDCYEFVINQEGTIVDIKSIKGITDGATTTTIDSVDEASQSIYGNNLRRYFVDDDLVIISIDGGVVSTISWSEMRISDLTDGAITMFLPTNIASPKVVLIADDANNELGNYLGDYILAYAPTAPALSSGKYRTTVQTLSGPVEVVLNSTDLNGWYDGKTVLILQIKSNGEYIVTDVASGDDFFIAGSLSTLDDHYTDIQAVDAFSQNIGLINGDFITIDGIVYKLADNALVYRSFNNGSSIVETDIGIMSSGDTAAFIHNKGMIELIIFKKPN